MIRQERGYRKRRERLLTFGSGDNVQEWVGRYYDRIYYVMRKTSGRDKLCALIQGLAKFVGGGLEEDSEKFLIASAIEHSMSDGRKIFKFMKWTESAQKARWALMRMIWSWWANGPRFMSVVHGLDSVAYGASFFYYVLDNVLWATKVGLLRSKIIPENQKRMWQGWRLNGKVVTRLGGITGIKRNRNFCSFYRSIIALLSEAIYLAGMVHVTSRHGLRSPVKSRDPRRRRRRLDGLGENSKGNDEDVHIRSDRVDWLAHFMAIVRLLCNLRILLNRLKLWRCTDRAEGAYAIAAAAMGIWKYATLRKPIKALDAAELSTLSL